MSTDILDAFHPAVQRWFRASFAAPTRPQTEAWPVIASGRSVLVAAPTGSGKTLTAFLAAIDALVREGIEQGLPDETRVVYVSPLKALSNDIRCNLELPLAGIGRELAALALPELEIRTLVRTGDTPQAERARMRARPPHIVVTTPESLYVLLTSASGRRMLASTRSVIVDEIHAIAPSKRGAHLALSLERLEALTGRPLTRIGLSATQKPVEDIAQLLVGAGRACAIIDTGHIRARDLAIELPDAPLEAVMSGEVWQQVHERLAELISAHRSTLVFVNTRRLAERLARHLSERLGEGSVAAHHGSLARDTRLDAERRLKAGELKVLVATASLELGIDIGEVDLVCQIGATRSIAAFLQRIGRSGHTIAALPKGRLWPLSRDDLCEAAALFDAVRRGELDRIEMPAKPIDVLAQQIVAEVAMQDWTEDALYALCRRAHPYRDLSRGEFAEAVRMLADGFHTRRGRRSAHVHRDAVNGVLRGRRGAALTAVTNGGTIPDTADYTVVLEPEAHTVGTVNEDFAVESLSGDVFQLGNTSYRILRVERGSVRVEDAHGAAPGIPFWLGEAPSRSPELTQALARLRRHIGALLGADQRAAATHWLAAEVGVGAAAAEQICDYLGPAQAALGALPDLDTVIFERFFDESGGMQLVIHAPFGGRINRAWGLALRKRFCRKFNFELQAAASDNSIVLSLASSHSFPLAEVARYLSSKTLRPLLVQALLAAPMFTTRWRWNAAVSLALPRFRGGRKLPPPLQRMESEDLLAAVFPDQIACGENIVGDREIPDHPLVAQTLHDCMHEAMDVAGLEALLARIENGEARVIACDLTEPSPLAQEILTARPYTFLDDAPLEERRTQAVMARRWLDADSAADLGKLDGAAIARVRTEVWPAVRNADELADALVTYGFLADDELAPEWRSFAITLCHDRRAARLGHAAGAVWLAAERLAEFRAVYPDALLEPDIAAPAEYRKSWSRDDALTEIVRDRLQILGPVSLGRLAAPLGLAESELAAVLMRLQGEGTAMQGHYSPGTTAIEWCDRRLLARVHRYTVNRLRAEIEPVEPRDFLRFLFRWQRVAADARVEGADALAAVISQLEGFEAPAAAWETEILPARIAEYDPAWLDELSLAGRVAWSRLAAARSGSDRAAGPLRTTPIVLAGRRNLGMWSAAAEDGGPAANLSSRASRVAELIATSGASFFEEIVDGSGLLRTQVEEALGELTALGVLTCDGFGGLRALLVPSDRRPSLVGQKRRRRSAQFGIEDAGRWVLARKRAEPPPRQALVEHIARGLLKRYGVMFWQLTAREAHWLQRWRELLRVYRRLEARGEIRGGRFVAGLSGEQFALPDAVGLLREVRREERAGTLLSLSCADPLNLVGILTPGARLASLTGNRLLYRDGVAIAALIGGELRLLTTLSAEDQWAARSALLRRQVPAQLRYLD